MGDAIAELAACTVEEGQWPELLPTLVTMVGSGAPAHMESALDIISILAGYITDAFKPALAAGLHMQLGQCLQFSGPEHIDVQMSAFSAIANFVVSLEEPKEREAFLPFLPAMLQAIANALQVGYRLLSLGCGKVRG